MAGADLVVSAGGTMNREAVVLGTPVYTTFAGRLGGVDERLIAEGAAAAAARRDDLVLERKPAGAERSHPARSRPAGRPRRSRLISAYATTIGDKLR